MNNIPKIPKEYLGTYTKACGYTITTPRKWTTNEIEWVKDLLDKGYTAKEIAYSINRTFTSVSIKIKRLSKKEDTYNKKHIEEKYKLNDLFLKELNPKSILDLYCGTKSFYKDFNTTTNDIDKTIEADYHEDAFKLLCKLYYENKKYDLIDLDPFGSAFDNFDLAVKMAKKGLIITLGELGHKRWKRFDYVSSRYNINSSDEFTIDKIIEEIKKIGIRNKKELIVWQKREWQNIGRVYFKIQKLKTTSQWKNKNKQLTLNDMEDK